MRSGCSLRLDMAQYRELRGFRAFCLRSLDNLTRAQLFARGQRLHGSLKQIHMFRWAKTGLNSLRGTSAYWMLWPVPKFAI